MNKNRLEAEILNKESSRDLQITIKSINPQKFIPNNYQSRRPTISIPTSVSTSPNYFSPKKADEDIEKKLDSIEEKISGFFNKMLEIKKKFNNLCKKDIKIGTTIGNFLEALKNVSSEYSTNESKILENKENNNESKDKKKIKIIL
jgi:septal ring factor EnvC (AmiA/AmiB activator)